MTSEPSASILVVDDNPATRYSTSRILRGAGFHVVEAETGLSGVEKALQGVELVVLDVKLPDIDGFEVCRRLRADERTARTPVVHLSATFVKDIDKASGLESGGVGYLTHPVEPPVLITTVKVFLRTRRAEEAMRRSEAKFRAIFDNAANAICLIDAKFTMLEVNPALCQMLGRDSTEVQGHSMAEFIVASELERLEEVSVALTGFGRWRGEFPVIAADGHMAYLEWNMSIHSDPGIVLAIGTDATTRILIEDQRRQLLTSEQAARLDAERANRLKDDFLATLSHELRTPLQAIVGWSDLLSIGTVSPEELAEGVEAIRRNAQAQTQLISDLLDVSRITSGKLRLNAQPVDLAPILETSLAAIRPSADVKGIVLERGTWTDKAVVAGDPTRLQQIVSNLLTNAVKFTPVKGKVRVDLERRGAHIDIVITDNGQGIRPEFLPYVFDRFRQAEGSMNRSHGGLGLGLAIVKHLVELQGGSVSAESQGEGLGASFQIRLPSIKANFEGVSAGLALAPPEMDGGDGNADFDLHGARILIVDDDSDARRLVRRMLADRGADVRDADNVMHALVALSEFRPQLLISDIGMPVRDGFDLIRELRTAGSPFLQLPAIALTAFARQEDKQRVLAAGFHAHLAKPIDSRELMATVYSLLRKQSTAARAE